jgi:multiple sugar transport system permease protein
MPARPLTPLLTALLLVALAVTLFPIFWIVSTSLKPPTDWNASPAVWLPSEATFRNYATLFDPTAMRGDGIGDVSKTATKAVLGSVLASVTATLLSVLIGLGAAISIVRYRPGGRLTPLTILSGRMFPPAAIAVPFVIIFSLVNLIDSYLGLIAIYVAATLPFSTWMIKSFLDDLPREIEEAAMIDGLSRLHAHLTVTVPAIRGGILSTALFVFILNWSEFLFALVLSYTNIETIPVKLAKYVTATAGTLYGVQAALAVLAMAPLVLAGFAIQNHLARGMTFGAIKR